ncbi:carboxylesterase family protein [Burkholderia sp. Bp9099]|uniref:carboxylesterase family protein n=1 Tax=Burkholderia sp. Bp9099 TaxID=2184568 RepID=UPI000F5F7C9F|nr:carboxylesterase family protein [Burkholderia sp. Bp9099]RQZ38558.1 hypothetical protein DIE17_35895 [Burkholderia sp. Bp9099]
MSLRPRASCGVERYSRGRDDISIVFPEKIADDLRSDNTGDRAGRVCVRRTAVWFPIKGRLMQTILASCEQGELLGSSVDGALVFQDIPYANDGGRYRDCLPPASWQGVRDCTGPGPVFPQLPSRLDFVMGPTAQGVQMSEDAYRLNVYTPSLAGNLPVLFWIHGGGFVTGGALPCYSGTELARSGRAVVVTFNYRLGILGNLCMPGVAAGNFSVTDILRALDWVRSNIERFGGNPEAITFAGQSAGAWYTRMLMGMKETAGLARSAAVLSLPGLPPLLPEEAHRIASDFCALAEFHDPAVDLRNAPVQVLLDLQARLLASRAGFGTVPVGFMPVAVDRVAADPVTQSLRFAPKPVMIGWTRHETGSFFASNPAAVDATRSMVERVFQAELGEAGTRHYERVMQQRPGSTPYAALVELTSYSIFKRPAIEAAGSLAKAGSDVYGYQFDIASRQPHVGAGHCFELPFAFGNFDDWTDAPMLAGTSRAFANDLSGMMRSYLMNFIETGDPNGDDLPAWTRCGPDRIDAMHFAEWVSCYTERPGFSAPETLSR